MQSTSAKFHENVRTALQNETLKVSLQTMKTGFRVKRSAAVARLPEFEALREEGKRLKDHVLAHLDHYLEAFEAKVIAQGGQVHWCRTAEEARATVLDICQQAGARTVTKGKSMIAEEIALNDHLEAHGIQPIETDLGEYIIQLRHEAPSHIIAPAIHVRKEMVAESFRATHTDLPADRPLDEPRQLLDEARAVLRDKFLAADVGITGANFLIAETGSTVIVTNEGNGDLTQLLPRVHVVLASLEKVVPSLEDATTLMRLLARSATGQECSTYTSFSTGPRRREDPDGPEEFHVVLLDNGRSALLGTEFQDILRCIRCGACMNHCPVYGAIGGHAYGWVYLGPMGSVLTPALTGIDASRALPNASTLCGRCAVVCPMMIPLPKMLRDWREKEYNKGLTSSPSRWGLALWRFFALRPRLYRLAARWLAWGGRRWAGAQGAVERVPFASAWTDSRSLAMPPGQTFMDAYKKGKKR